MLQEDCRACSEDAHILCKIVAAGCSEEGFVEGVQAQEEGLCRGGMGVDVLRSVG